MDKRTLKVRFLPLIVFGLVAIAIAVFYWLSRLAGMVDIVSPRDATLRWVLTAIGIILVVMAFPVFVASVRTIGREAAAGYGNHLVQEGIYRYSRNPMYFGLHVSVLGLGLILDLTSIAAAGVLGIAVGIITAIREEPMIFAKYGEPYLQYKHRTPFYIPNYARMFRESRSRNAPPAGTMQ